MSTVLIPKVPRTGPADAHDAAPQPSAPQQPTPPVGRPDEPGSAAGNGLAVVAVLVGLLTVVLAVGTTMTWVVTGLAVLSGVLGVAAILRARLVRSGMVSAVLAIVLSLGSLGLLAVSGFANVQETPGASSGSVTSDRLEISFGTVTRNENGTSQVEVTVRNTSGDPISTWASLAAMKGTKTVAAQGVGVKDLEPGAEVTQTVVFNAKLPNKVTFEVRTIL